MRFPCYGYVHQSVGIHTQHSPLVTKPLHCQALLRVQCKTTAVPRESSALQLEQTAKAWDCISTHLPFAVSSVSFLSFSVVAPDLHLQKWKQKELGMPAIVCVTGTCIKYSCKCSIRPHWPRYKQFVVLSNLFYSKYLCLHALVNGKCVNVWQDCSSCWVFDSVYCKISIPYAEWKYLYIKLIRWVIFMNVAQEVLQHQWQIFMQLLQKFRFCPVLKHEGVQGEKWNIWKRKLSRSFKKEFFYQIHLVLNLFVIEVLILTEATVLAAEPTMEKVLGGLCCTLQSAAASGLHSAKTNIFYTLRLVPLN